MAIEETPETTAPAATPRPWARLRWNVCRSDQAVTVCSTEGHREIGPDEAEANAALIVKAVNHHDELIAGLKEAIAVICQDNHCKPHRELRERLEAIVARAEGRV